MYEPHACCVTNDDMSQLLYMRCCYMHLDKTHGCSAVMVVTDECKMGEKVGLLSQCLSN